MVNTPNIEEQSHKYYVISQDSSGKFYKTLPGKNLSNSLSRFTNTSSLFITIAVGAINLAIVSLGHEANRAYNPENDPMMQRFIYSVTASGCVMSLAAAFACFAVQVLCTETVKKGIYTIDDALEIPAKKSAAKAADQGTRNTPAEDIPQYKTRTATKAEQY